MAGKNKFKLFIISVFFLQLAAVNQVVNPVLAIEDNPSSTSPQNLTDIHPFVISDTVSVHAVVMVSPQFAEIVANNNELSLSPGLIIHGGRIYIKIQSFLNNSDPLANQLIIMTLQNSGQKSLYSLTTSSTGNGEFIVDLPPGFIGETEASFQNLTYLNNGTFGRPIDLTEKVSFYIHEKGYQPGQSAVSIPEISNFKIDLQFLDRLKTSLTQSIIFH